MKSIPIREAKMKDCHSINRLCIADECMAWGLQIDSELTGNKAEAVFTKD